MLLFMMMGSTIEPRTSQKVEYTIMIDPSGDARRAGRAIADSLERAVTYSFAQSLQEQLKASLNCTVIITRSPGETVYPLQNANFANRLPIDLYLSLHCYHAPNKKHTISLYRMSRAESFLSKHHDLSLVPLNKAHWNAQEITQKYSDKITSHLQSNFRHQFVIEGVYALPCAPLIAIQSPSLAIEINCPKPSDNTVYSSAIAQAIIAALTS